VDIAYAVVAVVLSGMLIMSAVGKFQKQDRVVDMIVTRLGVPMSWLPWLGLLEIAGAIGLLVGIAWRPIGIAAGVGVVLYFVGAVIAHLRKDDHELQGAIVVGVLGGVATALAALSL
jgi:uncharacterized membrane protein YphA (DoxX/SURF4 family)